MTTVYWTGAESDDFYYQSSDGTKSNWSDNSIPQATVGETVVIAGTSDAPATAVASNPAIRQILNLTVGDYGTLEILAAANSSSLGGYVFATHALDITSKGTVVINTAAPVELGASCTVDGTLTILNNTGSVLDNDSISGSGTVNLIGSQLGTVRNPVAVTGGLSVVLQNNATLYADLSGNTGSIIFDTNTQNTLVLDDVGATINTAFYGVSEKSLFAISAADEVVPVSANWTQNADTGSWTVQINSSTGTIVTLDDVHTANGFIPGTASFSQDSDGNYILSESNASSSGTVTSAAPFTDTTNIFSAGLTYFYDSTQTPNTNHFSPPATTADNRADWADGANWALGTTPWDTPANSANFDTYDGVSAYGVIATANATQIASIELMGNSDLLISAQMSGAGYAFATASACIYGGCTLTIDTPSGVELGEHVQVMGTLKIENNPGKVVLDALNICGGGTIDVINSTFGSENAPAYLDISTLNIQENSTVYFGARTFPQNVIFDNTSNTVVFDGNENTISASFQNVSAGTSFVINNASTAVWNHTPVSAAYSLNQDGTYTLTITRSDNSTLVLNNIQVSSDFTPATTAGVSQLPDGDWVISTLRQDTCYLTGTLIRTDHGDVKVEDIQIGDLVAVLDDEKAFRPVIWTGYRDTIVSPSEHSEDAGYPIRIRANAFGENQPARDLLVTPEHCIYVDGGFVPARMLVNGTSIFYDHSITHYRYHHFETDRHSVVLAENLPSESYLDTGNRQSFTTNVSPLFAPAKSWAAAAAPLKIAPEQVQPVYERLCERAESLGMGRPTVPATITDPGLEVFTLTGQRLRRMRHTGDQFLFEIPAGIDKVIIRSRSSRPSDVIGPFCDDRRSLGVLIGNVKLWDSRESRVIDTHLNTDLPGWHQREHPDLRWTNGSATLPLGYREPTGNGVLCIQIVNAGPYLLDADETAAQALSA
ncbi:MAG: Hint domain-containing protein [Gluconobacter oxydans]